MTDPEPVPDDEVLDTAADTVASPGATDAPTAGTPADVRAEGTASSFAGPLPPPPRPVPAGVERVARALGLKDATAARPPTSPAAIPGYEILGVLGRGGMGVVYHARQVRLNREVALKMVLHGQHASPQEMRRLRSEAESIARLQHPNIVQIFEVGDVDGVPYCALEYVEGGSLADRMRGTPLPHRAAVECLETLCQALAYAHQKGILHRDLKPSNVLLTREGVPKVTDFGLAKQCPPPDVPPPAGNESSEPSQSQIVGTPSYMAPELLRLGRQPLQPAVDVYGLGAILYELLTGRPPFQAESPQETLIQTLFNDPVPPTRLQPKLSHDLDTICLKCLAKDPGRRYATAQSLQEDLRCFLDGKPISARPTPAWERAVKWSRRRPVAAVLLACAVLAAIILSFVGWGVAAHERRQARLLEQERNVAVRERNEKNIFLQKSFAASQQLKELADAMAALPEGKLRQQLQEERLKIYLEAVRQASGDPLISREQARTYQRLADIFRTLKRLGEALDAQRSANQIYLRLIQLEPRSVDYEGDYVIGLDRLGLLLKQNRDFEEAEEILREGIARAEKLVAQSPHTARYQSTLGTMLNNLATQIYGSRDTRQVAEARAMLERAIEHQQRAVDLDDNPMYSMFLRNHYGALAEALLRQGNYAQAAERALRVPTFFPDDSWDYKRASDFLERCRTQASQDTTIDATERQQRTTRYAEEADRLMKEAVRHGYKVST